MVIKIICKQCSREFEVPKCRESTAKFCSVECFGEGMKGHVPWNKKNLDEKEIIKLYKEEISPRIISEKFNCSQSSIYRILHKYDLIKGYGLIKSERHRKFMSDARKGENNPMYGKICWRRGLTKETDQRIRIGAEKLKGRKLSKEHRLKSIKNLRHHKKGEFRGKKIIPLKITCSYCNKEFLQYKDRNNKMKYCSLECYRNNLKDGGMSLEAREKIGRSSKENWKDPVYREKTIKAQLKGLMKRPTKYEKRIAELCIEYSLPFIYTGDGRFLINFKNPDFINKKDKIVIEVFFSYYKIRDYGSVEKYKEFCRNKYHPAGWKVIFIDEHEIDGHYQKRDNWKEVCLNKILEVKNEN